MKKISLCLTNYNRTQQVVDAFKNVLNDDRIGEVIISDDCSHPKHFAHLCELLPDSDKIHLKRQSENIGMSKNKAEVLKHAANEYCILFDSDNVLDKNYLDALYKKYWSPEIIFMPDFAKPHFDYRHFRDEIINKYSVKRIARKQNFDALMNTCNYFVHRETYVKVYQHNPAVKGCDTAWFNYLWLKAGYTFQVVPRMEYFHSVHDGSEWLKDADYNMKSSEEIKKMMLSL